MASLARLALLPASMLVLSCTSRVQQELPVVDAISYFPGTKDTMTYSVLYNGKEHGRWVKYYAPHVIMEERFFDHGRKVDTLRIWWPNGNLQALYPFVDDEYEGECTEWNEQGQMIRRMHYRRGHEEGPQQQWYDDGSVRSNYVIRDGRRYGLLGTKNCVNVSDSLPD